MIIFPLTHTINTDIHVSETRYRFTDDYHNSVTSSPRYTYSAPDALHLVNSHAVRFHHKAVSKGTGLGSQTLNARRPTPVGRRYVRGVRGVPPRIKKSTASR